MMTYKNISTLIFDFGGVLIDLDKERCIQSFKNLGFKDVDKYLGDFVQSGVFLQLETGQITPNDFRNEIRKLIGNPVTDEQIDKAWGSFLLDIPSEKLDMLLELRKKFKVLMLSNTNAIHIPFSENLFLQHKGLPVQAYFDKRYLSYEVGEVKPGEEIFRFLLEDANVKAENCLFLDDGLKNIEQARAMGFNTYWVQGNDDLKFLLNDETWG